MKYFLIFISLLTFTCIDAQIRQEYVIASIGGLGQQAAGTAYYTVGELSMIKTFSANGYVLTQGFLQKNLNATVIPGGGGAFPVKLLDFTGFYEAGTNHLNWQTASEINNDHFDVERMASNGDFKFVGAVKGAGTTEAEHSYALIDYAPLSGVDYYRLKQVDVDGHFTYSDIISVTTPITQTMTVGIYPNPAKGYVNIAISTLDQQNGTMTLTDILGNTVFSSSLSLSSGTNQMQLDLSAYQDGQYIVRLVIGTQCTTVKIVKQQ